MVRFWTPLRKLTRWTKSCTCDCRTLGRLGGKHLEHLLCSQENKTRQQEQVYFWLHDIRTTQEHSVPIKSNLKSLTFYCFFPRSLFLSCCTARHVNLAAFAELSQLHSLVRVKAMGVCALTLGYSTFLWGQALISYSCLQKAPWWRQHQSFMNESVRSLAC